ncbi:hypothetical protein BOX15_Mlig030399g1 [Macrostomum lignano]|uniref:SUEL-type lectin domain-containing protein n=2 Tax=Macrostomum lignano TaxID=282301 RepID=A0A1I8HT60_9PLAT|nr:hypothetical protein BOX15_Mlig030399g1 [Macrostomum lignano]
MQAIAKLLFICGLCFTAATASPFHHRDRRNEDRYCRSGLYIHDGDHPVRSGICPRRVDCARLLGLPPDQIRCRVEFLTDLNGFPDVWGGTALRYSCSRLADCAVESGRPEYHLCYKTSEVRDRFEHYNSVYPLRTRVVSSIEDGAFLCP